MSSDPFQPGQHPVPGQIGYLQLPALDVSVSAAFYRAVFGWTVPSDSDNPGFTDGSGHVIGHWRTDFTVAGAGGIRPYIYVDGVDEVVSRIVANGGTIVQPRYDEGNLWVAHFEDPAGNVLGVWELAHR